MPFGTLIRQVEKLARLRHVGTLGRLLARWYVKKRRWYAFGTLARGHVDHAGMHGTRFSKFPVRGMICKLILTLRNRLCFKHNTFNQKTRKTFMNSFLRSNQFINLFFKKNLTGYLVLIYSLLESSEEISRLSVIYPLLTFFLIQCVYILYICV